MVLAAFYNIKIFGKFFLLIFPQSYGKSGETLVQEEHVVHFQHFIKKTFPLVIYLEEH